jgi:hypothetical protein
MDIAFFLIAFLYYLLTLRQAESEKRNTIKLKYAHLNNL